MIKLSDIQKLDKVSYASVEMIIEQNEMERMQIVNDIKNFGMEVNDAKAYSLLDKECAENLDAAFDNHDHATEAHMVLRRAIIEQMKTENCGGVKNV